MYNNGRFIEYAREERREEGHIIKLKWKEKISFCSGHESIILEQILYVMPESLWWQNSRAYL